MRKPTRPREVGRGERVLPGLWRLRLPLPWPGVPHCNAWAIAAGSGIVLVDTGTHEPGSLGHLERALDQVRLRLEDIKLVVVTHAHADHCGQAHPIADRAGCEVWAHPNHQHFSAYADDPEAAHLRRVEIARQSGVPKDPPHRGRSLAAGPLRPDRDLLPGLDVETDLGSWSVHETPGHAPSHVVLFQRERRVLLSGDHLLGRVSLYFDYGYTPDPVGEFLGSLDTVEGLGARLALSGHGRPFADVKEHIDANRRLVQQRLDAVLAALQDGPSTAFDLLPAVYGEDFDRDMGGWLLTKVLCYLTHLEALGAVERLQGEPERWEARL
jgi:glyoxylase-like metal-dependent hydrolase (beta-lactamase superfamily II)